MRQLTYLIPLSAIAVLVSVSVALAQTSPDQSVPVQYGSSQGVPTQYGTDQGSPAQDAPQNTVLHVESLNIEPWGFYPAHMQVDPGTTVSWFNIDNKAHTVTADDGSFDSGTLRKDETYTHTFDTPGKWNYHSELDPDMTGSITVNNPSD